MHYPPTHFPNSARPLPDVDPLIRGPDHGRIIGNIKRLLEFGQIGEWPIHSILRGRMRVDVDPEFCVLVPLL